RGMHTLGIPFVSLGEGIDCTTPAGKRQRHILAALGGVREGTHPRTGQGGPAARRSAGKRPGRQPYAITEDRFLQPAAAKTPNPGGRSRSSSQAGARPAIASSVLISPRLEGCR